MKKVTWDSLVWRDPRIKSRPISRFVRLHYSIESEQAQYCGITGVDEIQGNELRDTIQTNVQLERDQIDGLESHKRMCIYYYYYHSRKRHKRLRHAV